MEYLAFLKTLHDKFIELSKKLKFDKEHPRHLYLIALYGSIIELSGCLITLLDKKFRSGVPPLFRSIVEAHVELKNLYVDAEYGYHMEASNHDQWIRVLKEAKKGQNPFLNDIAQWSQLDTEIKKHDIELRRLKKRSYNPLKIRERFNRAGMINEFLSIYNFLSCDAHSNIRALIDRHIEIKQNDFSVIFYKDKPLENNLSYLDTTAGILVDSSGMIHEFFSTGLEAEIKKYDEKLSDLRKRVLST